MVNMDQILEVPSRNCLGNDRENTYPRFLWAVLSDLDTRSRTLAPVGSLRTLSASLLDTHVGRSGIFQNDVFCAYKPLSGVLYNK